MGSLFKRVAMTPNGTAYEQQELSSTDKETLDKRVAVAKSAGWIVRGVRHSSDGVHVATMVRQQIIAGEVDHLIHLGQYAYAAIEDEIDQAQRLRTGYPARQLGAQDGVIDAGKELPHVALQDVGVAAGEPLAAIQRAVRALADAVGVAISDERALEERLDKIA